MSTEGASRRDFFRALLAPLRRARPKQASVERRDDRTADDPALALLELAKEGEGECSPG